MCILIQLRGRSVTTAIELKMGRHKARDRVIVCSTTPYSLMPIYSHILCQTFSPSIPLYIYIHTYIQIHLHSRCGFNTIEPLSFSSRYRSIYHYTFIFHLFITFHFISIILYKFEAFFILFHF